PAVLAVGGVARLAAAEVARGADLAVALLAQQLDEPGLVLDLLVEDARGHVVGPRVLAEGQVADLAPGADGAALGLQQHGQDLGRRGVAGQVGVGTAGAVGEVADVPGNAAAQLVDAGRDQLEVGPVFQPGVLADLLVVLVAGQKHAQDGVVVVRGELGPGGVDELPDQLFHVDAARPDRFHPDAL